jgi:hypothetical protein
MAAAAPAGSALVGRWASAGQVGPERVRVGPSGSAQTGRIRFLSFFEIFSSAKTNSEIPENAYKARKILQKSQKFHENS